MNHTAEPWRVEDKTDVVAIIDQWPSVIADCLNHAAIERRDAAANARRIAACVNACAGLDTELLEKIVAHGSTLPRRLEAMTNYERSEAERQRDEIVVAARQAYQYAACNAWDQRAANILSAALAKVDAGWTAPEGHNAELRGRPLADGPA